MCRFSHMPTLPQARLGALLRFRAAQAGQPGVGADDLLGRQKLGEIRLFRQIADALPRLVVPHGPVEQPGAAARRRQKPEQHLDGRRLARAVRAEKAEQAAAGDARQRSLTATRFSFWRGTGYSLVKF